MIVGLIIRGMMSGMSGMMGGGGGMILGSLWITLVAAALVALLVFLIRGDRASTNHDKAAEPG